MTNMDHCFKIQYAEFPDINLKINYAHEKYVRHVSAKKKVLGKSPSWIEKMEYHIKNDSKDRYLLYFYL